MMDVASTIEFMKAAHAGQLDKAGHPYWRHPLAVMERLGPDAREQERIVALLHDVIEDTDWTSSELIAEGFTPEVVAAVELLSRPAGLARPTYMEWVKSIAASGNRTAILVKIADNEENSSPARIADLAPDERDIVRRYERSLAILRPALVATPVDISPTPA